MAYDFNGTQYLEVIGAEGSVLDFANNAAFSISTWVNFATLNVKASLVAKGFDGASTAYELRLSDASSGVIQIGSYNGAAHAASATHGWATGAWHHVGGDYDGSAWHIYTDGTGPNTSTDATGPVNNAKGLHIGTLDLNGSLLDTTRPLVGRLAEVAIWNRALSAGEYTALAAGYSPPHCRNGLVFYAPLVRELISPVGGFTLTPTSGPTVFPHSRVIYPKRRVA